MAHACMKHRIRQHCFSPVVTSREIRPPIYLSSQAALAQLLHAVLEKGKADRCTGAGVTPIQPVPRVVVVVVVHSATKLEEGEDYCAVLTNSALFSSRFIMEAKVKLLLAIAVLLKVESCAWAAWQLGFCKVRASSVHFIYTIGHYWVLCENTGTCDVPVWLCGLR